MHHSRQESALSTTLPRTAGTRAGLSLLEVLLAFVLLTCALAAVGQRVFVGMTSATRLQQETEAAIRCESVLGMLLSGALPYQRSAHCSDDNLWMWSSELKPSAVSGLVQLTVTVWHTDQDRKFARCSFTRLVRSSVADVTGSASTADGGRSG
jgi:Tfp pilus assembly protein PilV